MVGLGQGYDHGAAGGSQAPDAEASSMELAASNNPRRQPMQHPQHAQSAHATWSPSRSSPAMRWLVVALFALAIVVLSSSKAAANIVTASLSCKAVTFQCVDFPDASSNAVHETVSVDGFQVASTTFTFDGPTG